MIFIRFRYFLLILGVDVSVAAHIGLALGAESVAFAHEEKQQYDDKGGGCDHAEVEGGGVYAFLIVGPCHYAHRGQVDCKYGRNEYIAFDM